jgi:hypothetical protein
MHIMLADGDDILQSEMEQQIQKLFDAYSHNWLDHPLKYDMEFLSIKAHVTAMPRSPPNPAARGLLEGKFFFSNIEPSDEVMEEDGQGFTASLWARYEYVDVRNGRRSMDSEVLNIWYRWCPCAKSTLEHAVPIEILRAEEFPGLSTEDRVLPPSRVLVAPLQVTVAAAPVRAVVRPRSPAWASASYAF